MLNINSILKSVLHEVQEKSESINVVDEYHVVDTISGVEFHLYDDYFQMTKGDEKPISVSRFSEGEKATIMELKNLITDPLVTQDKLDNHDQYVSNDRQRFADWFQNPNPVVEHGGVKEEEGTEVYVRN